MNLSNNKNLQLATKIFFILSLFILAFGIVDVFLRWYEVVELTLLSPFVWLIVLIITLLLLGISGKWKSFLLILFLGSGNFVFMIYVAFSTPISLTKSVKNSNYFLEATPHQYTIYQDNGFYNKVIAKKISRIFSTPNSKIGIVPFFEAKLLSETDEMMILEIETSGYQSLGKVQDTIQKPKN